uniref:1-methyl alkyl succinate synthase activase n=1 Tax=Azoarcus sp. HxN1 TaxID=83404 RepID=A9J4J6_9RHOO|nr:1-methyl alkyl succinate synthase activase [Azoarcus sp. HxN1]
MKPRQPLIADIQKFSVNDGPGFRTSVFLKGCSMRCAWCHNPETIAFESQIFWKSRLCMQCGTCARICPRGAANKPVPVEAAQAEGSTYYKIDHDKCDACMECVSACPYSAMEITGRTMSVDEIMTIVEQDMLFYKNSGGGFTLSGGDPTAFPDFSETLLREAKRRELHTCMDTNGHCAWSVFERVMPHVDIFLLDLKHLDDGPHREMTGVTNRRVLENMASLVKANAEVWIRIPFIPQFSDQIDYHQRVADFLVELPGSIARVDIIPFHNFCQTKYQWLGRDWRYRNVEAIESSSLAPYLELYKKNGLNATIGGSGFETDCKRSD